MCKVTRTVETRGTKLKIYIFFLILFLFISPMIFFLVCLCFLIKPPPPLCTPMMSVLEDVACIKTSPINIKNIQGQYSFAGKIDILTIYCYFTGILCSQEVLLAILVSGSLAKVNWESYDIYPPLGEL